jgi:hypothetical protein
VPVERSCVLFEPVVPGAPVVEPVVPVPLAPVPVSTFPGVVMSGAVGVWSVVELLAAGSVAVVGVWFWSWREQPPTTVAAASDAADKPIMRACRFIEGLLVVVRKADGKDQRRAGDVRCAGYAKDISTDGFAGAWPPP